MREYASLAASDEPVLVGDVRLTERERDVLALAVIGYSRSEIAEELCVVPSTVKTHLSHLYAKFGVSCYAELLAAAVELGY